MLLVTKTVFRPTQLGSHWIILLFSSTDTMILIQVGLRSKVVMHLIVTLLHWHRMIIVFMFICMFLLLYTMSMAVLLSPVMKGKLKPCLSGLYERVGKAYST